MSKAKGKPKTNSNPGWKAKRQELRRVAAEDRHKKYNALTVTEKFQRAGKKERAKLGLGS